MDTPWRHRHHGGCRSAISLPAIVLIGAIVITACADPNNSSTTPLRPKPVISLAAEPSSVGVNDSSTLTWLVWDADSCEASGAWSGSKLLSGSEIVGPLTTSHTFILTCKGTADDVQSSVIKGNLAGALTLKGNPAPIDVSASEAVTVTIVGLPPPPAPTVTLMANPNSVSANGSSTLRWSSTDATSCQASGAWSGTKAPSGSEAVGPLTATSAFILVCNGAGGSAEQSVMVSVNAPPPLPAPTVSLTASPSAIGYNGSTTLIWSSTDATSCVASGDWSGTKATAGSQSVGSLTQTSTFILTCGSAGQSVTVTVGPAPLPTVALTANPTTVDMNGSSTLSWSSIDATSCDAGSAWSGSKPLSGNESVGPLTETSTFTLTCTGPGGSTNRPVTVSVEARTVLHLAWNPNPDAVDGYITYFGPSVSTASTLLSNLAVTSPNFDPQAPAVEYDAVADLGLSAGDTVCFRLKAYNAYGTSGFSEGVCVTL